MDPAPKPNSRRLLSLGTLCVALVIAANTAFILWLNGSQSDSTRESGGDDFPLEIRLLDEVKTETRSPQAALAEANTGSEVQNSVRSGVESSVPALSAMQGEDAGPDGRNMLVVTGSSSAAMPPGTAGELSLGSSDSNGNLESSNRSPDPEAESQALACRVWGPIGAEEVVEELRQKIELAGDVIDIQAAEMSSDPDYLVYIDTDQNIDNARRLLKELESQSVDAYVISGGALMNSVSAGVFSRRSRAESHQQRLIEMGYDPIVEPLERSQTVYQLYARVPQGFETEGHASKDCAAIASLR